MLERSRGRSCLRIIVFTGLKDCTSSLWRSRSSQSHGDGQNVAPFDTISFNMAWVRTLFCGCQDRLTIIYSSIILASMIIMSPFCAAATDAVDNATADYRALMAFKSSSDVAELLGTWNGQDPCEGRWYGVICRNGRVTNLVLQNLKLAGKIDSLTALDHLRVLSLKQNSLNNSLPDMSNWKHLKLLYLSQNQISGAIPDSISALSHLSKLDLSQNILSGNITPAFNSLSNLQTFRLENNNFSGSIPNLTLPKLQVFNVSDNRLTGSIPASLSSFPFSSFQGNIALCGKPFLPCHTRQPSAPDAVNPTVVPSTPSSKPSSHNVSKGSSKLSTGAVIAIVVGDFSVLIVISGFCVLYCWKRISQAPKGKHAKRSESGMFVFSSGQHPATVTNPERGKLVFMDGKKQFDLEDLLRASAEMLGKGSLGTAYKAVLEDGSVVAVKRLKDISTAGRREFEQHMEFVGRLRHLNLVALRAYYYAKEEKLLVYDYMPNGSLFSLLHGNRGPGRTPLDWTTRLKIALGAARGLAFLHQECGSHKMPHGNLKSSNILLDKDGNACISDFGLIMMANSTVLSSTSAGYRAPEHAGAKKVSQRADAYSFGVLLLEILTGKVPSQSPREGDGIDLPNWVQSVVREEWTVEVFDSELMRYKNIEEEMVAMLQIAMACVSQSAELRPRISQVVKMIEDIGPGQSPQRDDSFDSRSLSPSLSEGASH
eukprot:c13801_g1_i2 orf=408-2543(-)